MLMASFPHHAMAWPADPDPTPSGIGIHREDDPLRPAVESFIQDIYRQRYGAQPTQFAPVLVSLRDAHGRIVAAAGYRSATSGRLFLERYLAAPVEQLLVTHAADPMARGQIVEVGHLAASRAGEGRRLIFLLGPHLAGENFQWVVGTLTSELRHLFIRIGVAPTVLGTADPAVLGKEAASWGSYYDHRPLVLAGRLDEALRQLRHRAVGMAGIA